MRNTDELWKKYKKSQNEKDREQLIMLYLPFVKYLTDRIAVHLPAEVRVNDREDLYAEGIIGLIDSVEKFDPERGIKFETFASRRVKGSIIDKLRKEDFLPKNVREQAKKIETAYHVLESSLGRKATDEEIIRELRMTKKEFYGILDRLKGITVVSLEAGLLNKQGEKFCFEDIIGEQSSVIKEFEKDELLRELAGFIENLEREERIVLETYYWDGLTLKETGKVLGISESRVCQIHTKIILKLRSSFRKYGQER